MLICGDGQRTTCSWKPVKNHHWKPGPRTEAQGAEEGGCHAFTHPHPWCQDELRAYLCSVNISEASRRISRDMLHDTYSIIVSLRYDQRELNSWPVAITTSYVGPEGHFRRTIDFYLLKKEKLMNYIYFHLHIQIPIDVSPSIPTPIWSLPYPHGYSWRVQNGRHLSRWPFLWFSLSCLALSTQARPAMVHCGKGGLRPTAFTRAGQPLRFPATSPHPPRLHKTGLSRGRGGFQDLLNETCGFWYQRSPTPVDSEGDRKRKLCALNHRVPAVISSCSLSFRSLLSRWFSTAGRLGPPSPQNCRISALSASECRRAHRDLR